MISKLQLWVRDLLTPSDAAVAGAKPQGEFVKGVNFGGEAVTIEGNTWEEYATALFNGLSVPGANVITSAIQPQPYAPAHVRKMLNSVIYKAETLEIQQTLPDGSYDVYLWMMENYQTHWHSMEVQLAGKTVATEVGKLAAGHWARYGAYPIDITNGVLQLTISTHNPQIDAHIMGMSIFRVSR